MRHIRSLTSDSRRLTYCAERELNRRELCQLPEGVEPEYTAQTTGELVLLEVTASKVG